MNLFDPKCCYQCLIIVSFQIANLRQTRNPNCVLYIIVKPLTWIASYGTSNTQQKNTHGAKKKP